MFSLEGKTIVVTGGGTGIGRGICLAVAEAGGDVVLTGRRPEKLENVAAQVRAKGRKAITVPSDITNPDDIQRIVDAGMGVRGYIHGWVNNAGSAQASDVGPLMTITPDKWDRVHDVNLKWTFFCMKAAAEVMTQGGSIVNVTSRSASQPAPNVGSYAAAKAGVESLTATAALEWGHLKIRVNGVAPGVVQIEDTQSMTSESRIRRQIETVPLRRLGEVEDVAPSVVYYLADESSWVSGTILQVTGGSRISVGVMSYLHKVNRMMDEREAAAEG
jgi:NAD(P)-dependent dehydrogenase (short-subunit alcohol dehydrogenase family)